MTVLVLPPEFAAQIEREARAAVPRECCGLIEGRRDGNCAIVTALHPVPNRSLEPDRFELDPVTHLRLMREAREAGHTIIGCYHSHPNGLPQPSERDAQGAGETDFLWLVAGVTEKAMTLGIFAWTGRDFTLVPRLAAAPD